LGTRILSQRSGRIVAPRPTERRAGDLQAGEFHSTLATDGDPPSAIRCVCPPSRMANAQAGCRTPDAKLEIRSEAFGRSLPAPRPCAR